jgi:hypothetical protein
VNPLEFLLSWYRAQCNGVWEHANGVTIETLATPGWMVTIDLIETPLQDKSMAVIRQQRSDTDWLLCEVDHNRFRGQGDVQKLAAILQLFQAWATQMSQVK